MNQHYEFWVSYYRELMEDGAVSEKTAGQNNDRLIRHCWQQSAHKLPFQDMALYFKVLYPGLLIGLSNAHNSQTPGADSEIQLGFTFDPVTGLPYLPASSVKGILRSAFLQNPDYVRGELPNGEKLTDSQLQDLELSIFGCSKYRRDDASQRTEIACGKDIFFDAYPVEPDREKRLLGIENITPHRAKTKELEGLTAPTPLSLLKVRPGVMLQFRFRLTDTALGNGTVVTSAGKLKLFQTILTDFGVGAKTNVGFGALEAAAASRSSYCYLEMAPETGHARRDPAARTGGERGSAANRRQDAVRRQPARQAGEILTGTVTGIKSFGAFVRLDASGETGLVHISEIAYEHVNDVSDYLTMGQHVEVVKMESRQPGKISLSIKRATGGRP